MGPRSPRAAATRASSSRPAPNTTTLTLQNLVLVPGPNSGVNVAGAAVQATSQLVLDGVSVNGANAGFGGSLFEIDFGPASFDLVVLNSSLTNSTGSALTNLNPSGMQVHQSVISGNTGSGISLGDGSPLEIVDSTITNQGGIGVSTTGQGFGLQPVVTISGSNVSGNGGGGFFCNTSCRTLTVTNSTINGNGATRGARTRRRPGDAHRAGRRRQPERHDHQQHGL